MGRGEGGEGRVEGREEGGGGWRREGGGRRVSKRIPCGHHFIKVFFFGVRKNVLSKVIYLKVNEKRN